MCEWCDKTMKTVTSFEKVRDAQQKGEDNCKKCEKRVETVERFFVTIRKTYEGKVNSLINQMRDDFKEKLKGGNLDGEDIQDMGAEDKASRGSSE